MSKNCEGPPSLGQSVLVSYRSPKTSQGSSANPSVVGGSYHGHLSTWGTMGLPRLPSSFQTVVSSELLGVSEQDRNCGAEVLQGRTAAGRSRVDLVLQLQLHQGFNRSLWILLMHYTTEH